MKSKIDIEEFRGLVFELVKLIPLGRATSYGAIAKAIGYPSMSRMVGRLIGGASDMNIPAHRLVNSQGRLSGKLAFETPTTMQVRLESEGIAIENDRIKDWRKVFWDPTVELGLDN